LPVSVRRTKKVIQNLLDGKGKKAPASPEKPASPQNTAIVKVVVNSDGELCVGGDTFDVKDLLKSKGARWESSSKKWVFPADKQALAMKFFNLSALPTAEVGVSTAGLVDDSKAEDKEEKNHPKRLAKNEKMRTTTVMRMVMKIMRMVMQIMRTRDPKKRKQQPKKGRPKLKLKLKLAKARRKPKSMMMMMKKPDTLL